MTDADDELEIKLTQHALVPLVDADGQPRQFAPFGAHPDACSVCPSRCCRGTVRASVADVVRFCTALKVPYRAAFTLVWSANGTGFILDEAPAEWAIDDVDVRPIRADFALRQDANGQCAHLTDLGGHFRCSVYDARPSACRLYPISWSSKDRIGGPPMVFCPVPYAVTPTMEADVRREIAWSIRGRTLHDTLAEEWENEDVDGPRTPETMTRFVLTRAAERLGESPELLFDDRTSTERMHAAVREYPRTAR